MNEQEFLAGYDPRAFAPVAVAVDLVIVAIVDKKLSLLLVRRTEHPQLGTLALPGSFLQPDEDLYACACRTAQAKVGIDRVELRQFSTFGAPKRDPRMRVVSVGYIALTTAELLQAAAEHPDREIATVSFKTSAEDTASDSTTASVRVAGGRKEVLAFDHNDLVNAAVGRLQRYLEPDNDIFGLLPPEFTLLDLQTVVEAIRGRGVNKPAFRKRMIDSALLEALDRTVMQGPFRPAKVYRCVTSLK